MASSTHETHGQLTPNAALRYAWYWYIGLISVPFILLVGVIGLLNSRETPSHGSIRNIWFIASVAFIIVASPIAFAIRSRLFRPYWRGESVPARDYLTGMLIVWSAFELGGILSLVGCVASNSLLPCLLPAIAAFLFFTALWPNGKAMSRPTGNTDDPEIYQEPR